MKPLRFTFNYFMASYHYLFQEDIGSGSGFIKKAFDLNPTVQEIFGMDRRQIGDYLLKRAIREVELDLLGPANSRLGWLEDIKRRYADNFYFQDLCGNLAGEREWRNLDKLSLEFLAETGMNPRTQSILSKIGGGLDRNFLSTLTEYVVWKHNGDLAEYLVENLQLRPSFGKKDTATTYSDGRLKDINISTLRSRQGIVVSNLGDNLMVGGDFENKEIFESRWLVSKMASGGPYSSGSFAQGQDIDGGSGIWRILGFFVCPERGRQRARAGIWYSSDIHLHSEWYIFGFDYLTELGTEGVSTWLYKGLEFRIPPSGTEWKTMIYILDNTSQKASRVKPFIRMWGVGTVLLDNVFLRKIDRPVIMDGEPGVPIVVNHVQ